MKELGTCLIDGDVAFPTVSEARDTKVKKYQPLATTYSVRMYRIGGFTMHL